MPVRVWPISKFPDREIIGDRISREAKFFAKHIPQEPFVRVGRHAIDLVVRRHHADSAGLLQRFFERIKECLAQHAHGNICRSAIHAGFRLPMSDEVLQCCNEMFLVAEPSVSLKPLHRRNPHPRDEERIFAVCLLHTSPARVPRNIDDRSERLVRASRPRLQRSHSEKRLRKLRIKSCSQRNRLRETGSVDGRVSV